jgi:hypothetical protein
MKTETKRKATLAPKFVADHIEDVRIDSFLHEEPAIVDVNAPRALMQATGEGHLQGIGWMLRQPLYAAAPEGLTLAKIVADMKHLGGEDRRNQEIVAYELAKSIIAKAEGRS